MLKTYFVIICDWCVDGESGLDIISIKENFESAKKVYQQQLKKERQNAENNAYDCIVEDATSFSAYSEGDYSENHIDLYIKKVEEKQ